MGLQKKVLLLDRSHPDLPSMLTTLGVQLVELYDASDSDLRLHLADAHGLVVRSSISIDRSLIHASPKLEFVARLGVGTEHIDMDYCKAKGIAVFTSPEGSKDTVAEHTIGMLLMLLNRLNIADQEVRQGAWIREENRGVELKGKTVGILGYGNMGKAFAERLQGFDVQTIAYDKFKTKYGNAYAKEVDLQTLQAESDILSIHIPYTPQNRYFIDGPFLGGFKKPIVVVNTARGTVLHTADLVAAMKEDKVIGAALDVIEYEEMSFSHLNPDTLPAPFQYLRSSDRTVLTPHIAGWSHESKRGHAQVLAEKIKRFWQAVPETEPNHPVSKN